MGAVDTREYVPTEHPEHHRAKADAGQFCCGINVKLPGKDRVCSHDHVAEDISDDRWARQPQEVLGHLQLARLIVSWLKCFKVPKFTPL